MIYIVELESLKERYTSWWNTYIPDKFRKVTKDIEIISGKSLGSKVEVGTVLDAAGTNYWKAIQLQKIAKLFHDKQIKPYSHFFIADIWFPGDRKSVV